MGGGLMGCDSENIMLRILLLLSEGFLPYREAIDTEGDGEVSKEEFVVNATQSKFIFNMLKN